MLFMLLLFAEIDCWRRKRRLKPAKIDAVHLSIYGIDCTSWLACSHHGQGTHYIELSTKMDFTTSKVLFVHINDESCTPFISISATSSWTCECVNEVRAFLLRTLSCLGSRSQYYFTRKSPLLASHFLLMISLNKGEGAITIKSSQETFFFFQHSHE
jgi:hypothetical protein